MKYASDFRAIARDALRGKWVIAVIVGLVAALLGAGSDGPRVKLNINDHGANLNVGFAICISNDKSNGTEQNNRD